VSGLRVDRCFCYARTFASLHSVAEATGARSVADLQEHVRFGAQCGLCRPYVRRMLRTGGTVFAEIVTEADEPPGDPAG
jgi:bacterioferritin-associated ferredoxin